MPGLPAARPPQRPAAVVGGLRTQRPGRACAGRGARAAMDAGAAIRGTPGADQPRGDRPGDRGGRTGARMVRSGGLARLPVAPAGQVALDRPHPRRGAAAGRTARQMAAVRSEGASRRDRGGGCRAERVDEFYAIYDLWGLSHAGIGQLKAGFGGRAVNYVGGLRLDVRPLSCHAAWRRRRRPTCW